MKAGWSEMLRYLPPLRGKSAVEIIDLNVSWDSERSKLSPGERILVLIINLLTNRHPLYKVWECYYGTDVELLLGVGILDNKLSQQPIGLIFANLAQFRSFAAGNPSMGLNILNDHLLLLDRLKTVPPD